MNTTLIIVMVFAIFLIGAVVAYLQKFYRPLMKADNDIKNLTERLNAGIASVNTFEGVHRFCVEHFEDINSECLKSDAVRFIWNDFRKSLVRYKNAEVEEIYSIADAAEYFSYRNFTREMNMPFWNSYGGIFTGLGILGTFFGLTVGLSDIDMTGSDVEVLKTAIASLLSGVQFAFLTSLLGIFFAILYGPWHNGNVNGFKRRVRNLALLMEKMFPRRTAEEWLHKNYVESEAQTLALKNIGADVAQAIYEGFDERFDEGISRLCDQIEEKIAPFFGDIQKALNNLNVGFGDAVGRVMSEQAGSQMQSFAQTLDDFTVNLQQSMTDAQQLNAKMNENVLSMLEKMRQTLKEGAEETVDYQRQSMKENADAINQLVGGMWAFAESQKQMMSHFVEENAGQMKSATEQLNEKLSNTLENIRQTLKEGAEENAKQMKAAAELFQSVVDKHNEAMAQYHNSLLELEKSTENVLNQVKESATMIGQAAEPLQQSTILIKECLTQTEQATKQLHDEISNQMTNLINVNQQSQNNIDSLITGLQEYKRNIERAWLHYENNFNRVGGELERATDIITERLQKYNEMMNGSMMKALTDFDKSMSNAIGLLQSLAEDLQDSVADLQKKRQAD